MDDIKSVALTVFLGFAGALFLLQLTIESDELHKAHADLKRVKAELNSLKADLEKSDEVIRAISGDSLELKKLGKVKIIGVDIPNVSGYKEGVTTNGDPAASAYRFMQSIVGRRVCVRFENKKYTTQNKLLVHMYLLPQGPDIATHITQNGWSKT